MDPNTSSLVLRFSGLFGPPLPRAQFVESGTAPVAQFVSPTDLVRSVFAALDAKDPAAVTERMTDDVRMRLGNADFVEGKAKFREATAAFVASITAISREITSMWSVDDVVIAEIDVHYERLDGRKLTLPCCNVFRVRDGLVSDYRVYLDIGPVYRDELRLRAESRRG